MRMRRTTSISILALACLSIISAESKAQLSTNPDKFLGNITTYYNVDYGSERYYTLWNQITCENETKWSSVEGTRGSFSWWAADNAYNYAKDHNFPFKFHTLVWGSQFPGWVKNLSVNERYAAIVNWIDKVKQHYPNLEMIDVVNEAINGHQQDTHYISEALGGPGETGYDWIIKAFELAYERWPNAILIYNDFNTFQWDTDRFIDLVRTLRDAGAPIDAYGCQSHDVTDISFSDLKSSEKKIQSALKMPMYITEYDIGLNDDDAQAQKYKEQIPFFWQKEYCAGITLWGYIYGATWTGSEDNGTKGNSGIIRVNSNNKNTDRPAMTWLRTYMASDAAKTAQSPFPGMKKEASVYVGTGITKTTVNQSIPVTVRACMRTKTIQNIEVSIKHSEDIKYKTAASFSDVPYTFNYTPTKTGYYNIKTIVTTTDGSTYTRYSGFTSYNPRIAFKTMTIPGTIQAEDFDICGEGITFHDADSKDEGNSGYRKDNEGVDIVKINGGYAIGYTSQAGEWLEYTVNAQTTGTYDFVATVSSGSDNSGFRIGLMNDGVETQLAQVSVPNNGSWDNYTTVTGTTGKWIGAGKQILRITITGPYCNIDKIQFKFKSDVKYITDDDRYSNGNYYNLAGQRVNGYKRGITIKDGKKVFIVK